MKYLKILFSFFLVFFLVFGIVYGYKSEKISTSLSSNSNTISLDSNGNFKEPIKIFYQGENKESYKAILENKVDVFEFNRDVDKKDFSFLTHNEKKHKLGYSKLYVNLDGNLVSSNPNDNVVEEFSKDPLNSKFYDDNKNSFNDFGRIIFNSNNDKISSKGAEKIIEYGSKAQKKVNDYEECTDKTKCIISKDDYLKAKKKLIFSENILLKVPASAIYQIHNKNMLEDAAKMSAKGKCRDSFFSTLCYWMSSISKKTILKNSVEQDLLNLNKEYNDGKINFVDYNKKLNQKYKKYLGDKIEIKNDKFIYKKIEYSSIDDLNKAIRADCSNSENVDCKNLLERVKITGDIFAEQRREKSSTEYKLIDALFNPDPLGLDAARLFGVEADYSHLTPWLQKKNMGSAICKAKVFGKLDKESSKSTNIIGGSTLYGSCSQKFEDNSYTDTDECKEIVFDIRAEGSKVMPDKKMSLIYSLLYKNVQRNSLEVLTAILYRDNQLNIHKKLVKKYSLLPGGVLNDYITREILINQSLNEVDMNSFILVAAAFINGTNTLVFKKSTPILIMTFNDRVDAVYNQSTYYSSSVDGLNSKVNSPKSKIIISNDDLLSLI